MLRVFLPLVVFGVLVRFGWCVVCSFMRIMLLRMVKLLLWWVMSVNDFSCVV